MNQDLFVKKYTEEWDQFEAQLDLFGNLDRKKPLDPGQVADFPHGYRRLCKHLALARDRHYGPDLVDRLNHMALRGHQILYAAGNTSIDGLRRFLFQDFPRAVRAESRLFWLCSLLFYGPYFGLIIALHFEPALVYSVIDVDQVLEAEEMYSDANKAARTFDMDMTMFGFYIYNNISIAFRTFTSGILAGLGSLFFLIFNGLIIGTVTGHMMQSNVSHNFMSFIAAHGSFELTAIVLSGVAGFKLGLAVVAPGNLSRPQALVQAGKSALPIVYGMTLMLLIAAFIEAFWSPRDFPLSVKYTVGACLWTFVYAYLFLMGRSREN